MDERGKTRAVRRPEYLLQTPDTFVRTPLPGLSNGMAVVHASAALGAEFLMYTAELETGGELAGIADTQRFCYVLEGEFDVRGHTLRPGDYSYLPNGDSLQGKGRVLVIEKDYEGLEGSPSPLAFSGCEAKLAAKSLGGDPNVMVGEMLPAGDWAFDFAVNTMTYAPGAALSQVEVHYMEHGLLMLSGEGEYRLGEEWFPVQAGDFIWMGPYCPQWFGASLRGEAKYLIYKNFNRRPRT